jgi:hypothetical protein
MMGSAGITNVGPINTPVTGTGAIAGFDPIMSWKKAAKRKAAGKAWDKRRNDPSYIDGRSKAARKLVKRLAKRKKKMSEEFLLESGEATKQAYKFISQRRKVQKKQEREKRAANRKQEIGTIARAKASDYQKKAKDRQKKLSQSLQKQKSESFDGLTYLMSLIEQVQDTNTNPVTYFFNDDSELELTQEAAAYVLIKFNELSEEHKDEFVNSLPESSTFTEGFIEI